MKKIVLLPFALLPFLFSFSQKVKHESTAALANNGEAYPKTLLWKISGNGLKKPSYLFGTMHILCADDAQLSDSLKDAIRKVDEVYFEIDLTDMKGMMNSLKYMRMNDEKRLSDILNADDYAKVKGYFEKHPAMLPFGMLERFKPLLISSIVEENDLDCKTTNGMEMVIMKEAKDRNKKIHGLETAEFQAALFDSIPYEKQAKDLVDYLDSTTQYKKMTDTLAMAYKQQDLQRIDELTTKEDPSMSNYMDLMLYDRNRKWVRELKKIMIEKPVLIAVGAGHLPGQKGVINLLKKNGYKVTPVKNPPHLENL
ncbi:MAG: TraB/GumN family protein [Bacteroidetes bacterium]|nr:TraB/GumN family protein [Bacteroidota bacterium]